MLSRTVFTSVLSISLLALGTLAATAKGQVATDTPNRARLRGLKAAIVDLESGILRQKEYPPMPYSPAQQAFIRLLKSNCGVDWQVVDAPADSKEMRAEVDGYNDVMRAEIEHRFGRDIFTQLRKMPATGRGRLAQTGKDFTDFKLDEVKPAWLRPVKTQEDPQSGFAVGGKNPTSRIQKLAQLNGKPIATLEKLMRPGAETNAGSAAGFLGAHESLLGVLERDNDYVVGELGLSHQELARHLLIMGAIGVQHPEGSEVEFTYHGRRMRLTAIRSLGYQYSPFMDGTRSNVDVTVRNLDRQETIKFSMLVPMMIDRYGFYEGKGTPYRVDPSQVLNVFDFLKPTAK